MYEHFTHLTQTQLGEIFGVTSHQIGRWLRHLGLKEGSKPTAKAQDAGIIQVVSTDTGTTFPAWHREKTVTALEQAGHRRVDVSSTGQDRPLAPFAARANGADGYELVDANGFTCMWVRGEGMARLMERILAVADETGVFERYFGSGGS